LSAIVYDLPLDVGDANVDERASARLAMSLLTYERLDVEARLRLACDACAVDALNVAVGMLVSERM
jgi:hypothetical protein